MTHTKVTTGLGFIPAWLAFVSHLGKSFFRPLCGPHRVHPVAVSGRGELQSSTMYFARFLKPPILSPSPSSFQQHFTSPPSFPKLPSFWSRPPGLLTVSLHVHHRSLFPFSSPMDPRHHPSSLLRGKLHYMHQARVPRVANHSPNVFLQVFRCNPRPGSVRVGYSAELSRRSFVGFCLLAGKCREKKGLIARVTFPKRD
jgi:hypothetical protein